MYVGISGSRHDNRDFWPVSSKHVAVADEEEVGGARLLDLRVEVEDGGVVLVEHDLAAVDAARGVAPRRRTLRRRRRSPGRARDGPSNPGSALVAMSIAVGGDALVGRLGVVCPVRTRPSWCRSRPGLGSRRRGAVVVSPPDVGVALGPELLRPQAPATSTTASSAASEPNRFTMLPPQLAPPRARRTQFR